MAYPFNDLVLNQDMDTESEEGPLYEDEDNEDEWKDDGDDDDDDEEEEGNFE